MNGRKMAIAIVAAILALAAMPLCVQSSDALDSDSYYIILAGTDAPEKPVYVTIANGENATWNLHVVNESKYYMDVNYTSTSDSNSLTVEQLPSTALLGPKGSGENHISSGQVTIKAKDLADTMSDVPVTVTISVTEISETKVTSLTTITFLVSVESIYDSAGMYNKFFGIFPNTLPSPLDTPWVPAIVSVVLTVLIGALICHILVPRVAKLLYRRTTEEEAETLNRKLFKMVTPLIALAALTQSLYILDADTSIISDFSHLATVISIVLISFILWDVYIFIVTSSLTNIEKSERNSAIDTSLVPLFKMIGRIIFWVGGATAILGAFGVDLTGILVSAGVISLGITLGAQNVLSQFFSGLVILTTRPFKAGDFLKINDKVYIVRKVKLMYTEFGNWAGDEIITMPNNVVTNATISNMTKGDKICRQYVFFSVAYGTDLKKAEQVMIDTANKCDLVVQDKKHSGPEVRVTNFLSSGIELRLSVHTPTFDDTGAAAGKLRGMIYEAFAENDIEIPYDRVQIDILSDHSEKKDH